MNEWLVVFAELMERLQLLQYEYRMGRLPGEKLRAGVDAQVSIYHDRLRSLREAPDVEL